MCSIGGHIEPRLGRLLGPTEEAKIKAADGKTFKLLMTEQGGAMRQNTLVGPVPSGIEYHDHIASQWTQRYTTKSFSHRLCLFCSILDRNIIPG